MALPLMLLACGGMADKSTSNVEQSIAANPPPIAVCGCSVKLPEGSRPCEPDICEWNGDQKVPTPGLPTQCMFYWTQQLEKICIPDPYNNVLNPTIRPECDLSNGKCNRKDMTVQYVSACKKEWDPNTGITRCVPTYSTITSNPLAGECKHTPGHDGTELVTDACSTDCLNGACSVQKKQASNGCVPTEVIATGTCEPAGSPGICNSTTCANGCCDANGKCHINETVNCGTGGNACWNQDCSTQLRNGVCQDGHCCIPDGQPICGNPACREACCSVRIHQGTSPGEFFCGPA